MAKSIIIFFIGGITGGIIGSIITVRQINKKNYQIGRLNNKKIKKILRWRSLGFFFLSSKSKW